MKIKKILQIFGIFVLLLCITLFCATYYFVVQAMQDFEFFSKAVLHPIKAPKEAYEVEPVAGIKKISLFISCADGSKMHALYFKKPGADKIFVVNHGAGGNLLGRVYIAQSAALANCSTLLYDYRGYALSTGKFNLDSIIEDGLTAYDYAHEQLGYPAEKIIVCGESIGSAVACHTAANRPCAGLLLLSGVTRLPVAIRKIIPAFWIFPDACFAKTKIDNPTTIKNVHVPVLLVHGKLDEQVPYECSQENFAAASEPKKLVLLSNCGHDDVGRQNAKEFQSAINEFVASPGIK